MVILGNQGYFVTPLTPRGHSYFYSSNEQKLINDGFQKSFAVDSSLSAYLLHCERMPSSHGHPTIFQMNALDSLGQTALHRAALAGHLQTCRLLLSYGSDPSIISLQGFTAAQMGNEAVQQILSGESRDLPSFCSPPPPHESGPYHCSESLALWAVFLTRMFLSRTFPFLHGGTHL